MPYVYILECSDKTLYTGWTTNIHRRLKEHNKGIGSKYTRSRYPVKLMYLEEFNTNKEAMKRECEIKKLTRQKKIKLVNYYDNRSKKILMLNSANFMRGDVNKL